MGPAAPGRAEVLGNAGEDCAAVLLHLDAAAARLCGKGAGREGGARGMRETTLCRVQSECK